MFVFILGVSHGDGMRVNDPFFRALQTLGGLKGADGVRSLVTGWSVSAQWFVSPLDLFSHVFTPIYWLSLGTKIHSAGLRKRRGGLGWNGALHNRICVKHDRLGVTVVCHQCCNPVYIATERDSVHSWDMPMALSFILETPSVVNCFVFFLFVFIWSYKLHKDFIEF